MTKQEIIETACALSAEKGIDRVATEDIVRETGISEEEFSRHFDSLELLLFEVVLARYAEIAHDALKPVPAEDGITILLIRLMDYIVRCRVPLTQIWLSDAANPREDFGTRMIEHDREILRHILENAVERGELRADLPVKHIVDVIITTFYGTVFCWCVTSGSLDAVGNVIKYCAHDLPLLLNEYKTAPAETGPIDEAH